MGISHISSLAWRHQNGMRLICCASLIVVLSGCGDKNKYIEPPPPEVTVAYPTQRDVTNFLDSTATAYPITEVKIRARVRGILKECLVQEGADVQQGQLLLVIDEEPFKVQLDAAKAKLDEAKTALKQAKQSKAREIGKAQLALDESQLHVAITEEERMMPLLTSRAISQEEFERAVAERKKCQAQVDATKANLLQAEAYFETKISTAESHVAATQSAVRNAEIDLGYCRIKSPITGRIGRILHDVGNLVGDDQATLLTTVVKYDPIHVYTTLSVEDYLKYSSAAKALADNNIDQVPIQLTLGNESGYSHKGKIDYQDPVVDKGTGTIQLRGVFSNPDAEILPGMFARVRIPIANQENALLVPESALGIDQSGSYLLVVDKTDKVDYRHVEAGQVLQGMRVVQGNIGPQDRIIVEGLLRARPGMKVNPQPEVAAIETDSSATTVQQSATVQPRRQKITQTR